MTDAPRGLPSPHRISTDETQPDPTRKTRRERNTAQPRERRQTPPANIVDRMGAGLKALAATRSSSARTLTPTPIPPCPRQAGPDQNDHPTLLTRPRSYRDDLRKRVVGPVGLEPTTGGLKVRCSTD